MRGAGFVASLMMAVPAVAQDTAAGALREAAAALALAAERLDRAAVLMEAEDPVLMGRAVPDRETLDAIADMLDPAGRVEMPGPWMEATPPLTGAEVDAFRLGVQGCWRVDPGSESGQVQVTVNFQLDRDGRIDGDVQLVRDSGGSQAAVNAAFESARRALLRCQGRDGYQLPADKYDQWRDVTLTFDPFSLRIR